MKCDIIIPVYQNATVLPETLAALGAQIIPPDWHLRLLVSDDGSSDATLAVARHTPLPDGWKREILTGPHAGPGAARNRALARLAGDIVLFLGADILLRPGALAAHLEFHSHHPSAEAAALGMVRWDPRLLPTPLMEWMVHGGQQNDFDSLLGQSEADPRTHWYCSHLSLKTRFLGDLRFPENFGSYGWEDVSLGRAAAEKGARLYVLPTAVGLHRHMYSSAAIAARQYAIGLNIPRFQNRHPSEPLLPPRSLGNHLRRFLFIACGGQALLLWCMVVWGKSQSLPRLFLVFTATQFWRGVWRSQGGFLAYLRKKS